MNKTKIVKFAISTITGAGTHHVTNGIIKNNVDLDDLNSFGKFTVGAANAVIATMAAAKTKEYTDAQVDEFVAAMSQIKFKKNVHEGL